MLSNLIFVLNAVLPVFLLIGIGLFLKQKGQISSTFVKEASGITFNIALPVVLFQSMARADFSKILAPKLIAMTIIIPILVWAILWVFGAMVIKDKAKLSAFVHGSFNVNFAILSLPICQNLFGPVAYQIGSLILCADTPVVSILAAILLTVCNHKGEKINFFRVLWGVVKNPFIIASILGILWNISHISMPVFMDKTLTYLSAIAVPLALITIGGSMDVSHIKNAFHISMAATIIKTIITPIIFIPIGIFMGIKGYQLGILFVYCSAPAAVSSYIMSAGMGADADIASNIVVYSTILSGLIIVAGTFLLKTGGLI